MVSLRNSHNINCFRKFHLSYLKMFINKKVAIVTDGARGQGNSHAGTFVNEGAKVVVTDIRADEGQALVKELGESAYLLNMKLLVNQIGKM